MNTSIKEVANRINGVININNVVLFTTSTIKDEFESIKGILDRDEIEYLVFNIDEDHQYDLIREELARRIVGKEVILPIISLRGVFIGNYNDIIRAYHTDELFRLIYRTENVRYNYDLIVVGGGIAGIAAAKEAELFKKRVAIFDYVKPTNQGTVWKEGGTSLNVGSIPKKLMYHSSRLYDFYKDGEIFGWELQINKKLHNWQKMFRNIQNIIKNKRKDILQALSKERVDYFNAFVNFKDKHTIEATDKNGNTVTHTATIFILATGSHTELPEFPGSNLLLTTDDLFMLPNKPGKTLIIGAESITLELAGILNNLGVDCTIMTNKSIIMKDYDSEMVDTITNNLISIGVKILTDCVIVEITASKVERHSLTSDKQNSSGTVNPITQTSSSSYSAIINPSAQPQTSGNQRVRRLSQTGSTTPAVPTDMQYKVRTKRTLPNTNEVEKDDIFDLVVLAGKRRPTIKGIGLEDVGVKINEKNSKLVVDEFDRTTCSTIFAVGDVQTNRSELASVAEKSAKLLIRRMFSVGYKIDYEYIPKAVFTPLEYSFCGYTEQNARELYGDSGIVKYYSNFVPLEWAMRTQDYIVCCVKLICLKAENLRVIGLHIVGPNASEITQGFALSLKAMVTKHDFDRLIGIHPTCATIFTNLRKL